MPDWTILFIPLAVAWVGHACIWVTVLNYVYAKPFPKPILRIWRLFTGLLILSFPVLPIAAYLALPKIDTPLWQDAALVYTLLCLLYGSGVLPGITAYRRYRKRPAVLLSESTQTLDLWQELGPKAIGDGKGQFAAKLPFNCVYRVDFTELTLALPNLPPEWHGLTILHISDVHYHGTPSRAFHERVMAEIESRWPKNDLVCLTGDFVDTYVHHEWIGPLLGRFRGVEGNFAILGNHDLNHEPERVRSSLREAGYTVLGNGWHHATIRGVPSAFVGHEGPWFPTPDLVGEPEGFRFCLSHTPDNFYWGQRNRVGLMLCGHVHGGQIRLPIIGSIFVPSMYGRRFDMGVFEGNGSAMVVNRGLSGKEPLRFRCNPQVIRITLTRASEGG